jgi:sugar lactone lactonase YvrE
MDDSLTSSLAVDSRCILGEGIVWSPVRRALFWTDIEARRLWMHVLADATTRSWTVPDRLGCFVLCESGKVLLGLAKGLFLADFDGASGSDLGATPVAAVEADRPRTRINDGRTDRAGNFVFGTYNEAEDGATGSFYQYSSRHGLRRLDVGGVTIANSICFSPDGRTMYYGDSPAGQIMQCEYDAESATTSNIREFVRYGPGHGFPDGSVIDTEGFLWNAVWAAGKIRRFAPDGRLDREVPLPPKNVTCVCFGGPDGDHLYVTSSRQQMTEEELARTPTAGGVYRVLPGKIRGTPDALFRGL